VHQLLLCTTDQSEVNVGHSPVQTQTPWSMVQSVMSPGIAMTIMVADKVRNEVDFLKRFRHDLYTFCALLVSINLVSLKQSLDPKDL